MFQAAPLFIDPITGAAVAVGTAAAGVATGTAAGNTFT